MAESKDAHVVEIPVIDEDHQQKLENRITPITISAIQHHPLMEIALSPGHLLLLKLWQREEDLFGRRIAIKETKSDTIRRQIFQLCSFYFLFHFFFLTLLFSSSHSRPAQQCRKWWIPAILSGSTSLVMIGLVQVELWRYWKVWRALQRERSEGRALGRCVQELRMKGASFDLGKESLGVGGSARRMKSSSVEIKWKPITWYCLSGFQAHPLQLLIFFFFPKMEILEGERGEERIDCCNNFLKSGGSQRTQGAYIWFFERRDPTYRNFMGCSCLVWKEEKKELIVAAFPEEQWSKRTQDQIARVPPTVLPS